MITIQQQRSKPRNDNVVDCLDFEPGCDNKRLYKLTVEIEQKNNIHSVFDASNRNQLSNKRIHNKRLLNWYREILCHPNSVKQLRTMQTNFIWKNMQKDIETFSQHYHTFNE